MSLNTKIFCWNKKLTSRRIFVFCVFSQLIFKQSVRILYGTLLQFSPIQFVKCSFIFMPTLVRISKFLTIPRTRIIHPITQPCCILKIICAILQVLLIVKTCSLEETSLALLTCKLDTSRVKAAWYWTGANRLRAKRGKTVFQNEATRRRRCVGITDHPDGPSKSSKTLATHSDHPIMRFPNGSLNRQSDTLACRRIRQCGRASSVRYFDTVPGGILDAFGRRLRSCHLPDLLPLAHCHHWIRSI